MIGTNRRPWATLGVCLLLLVAAVAALNASAKPAAGDGVSPLREATTGLTIVPPPAVAPAPTTEPAPTFTPDEQRYLQVLHEQDEFEAEYPADGTLALIGGGICSRRAAGATVPDLVDWVDYHGYTSLASGWIVGTAVQELCPKAGDRS